MELKKDMLRQGKVLVLRPAMIKSLTHTDEKVLIKKAAMTKILKFTRKCTTASNSAVLLSKQECKTIENKSQENVNAETAEKNNQNKNNHQHRRKPMLISLKTLRDIQGDKEMHSEEKDKNVERYQRRSENKDVPDDEEDQQSIGLSHKKRKINYAEVKNIKEVNGSMLHEALKKKTTFLVNKSSKKTHREKGTYLSSEKRKFNAVPDSVANNSMKNTLEINISEIGVKKNNHIGVEKSKNESALILALHELKECRENLLKITSENVVLRAELFILKTRNSEEKDIHVEQSNQQNKVLSTIFDRLEESRNKLQNLVAENATLKTENHHLKNELAKLRSVQNHHKASIIQKNLGTMPGKSPSTIQVPVNLMPKPVQVSVVTGPQVQKVSSIEKISVPSLNPFSTSKQVSSTLFDTSPKTFQTNAAKRFIASRTETSTKINESFSSVAQSISCSKERSRLLSIQFCKSDTDKELYGIREDMPLKNVMNSCCFKMDMPYSETRFVWKGKYLSEHLTPKDVGMQDGESVLVCRVLMDKK